MQISSKSYCNRLFVVGGGKHRNISCPMSERDCSKLARGGEWKGLEWFTKDETLNISQQIKQQMDSFNNVFL